MEKFSTAYIISLLKDFIHYIYLKQCISSHSFSDREEPWS